MSRTTVELYITGSCLRNPGAGGFAYIIRYWDSLDRTDVSEPKEIEGAQGFRLTTSNRMNIMAAIYGLKSIIDNIEKVKRLNQVKIYSTSEYLCNAVNQGWIGKWMCNNWMTSGRKDKKPQLVKNSDLWKQYIASKNEFWDIGAYIELSNVERQCNEWIKKANKLAYEAAIGTKLIADEKFEALYNMANRK